MGIQAKYCRTNFDQMRLRRVAIGRVYLSETGQRTLLKATIHHPRKQLIVMASEPNDEQALAGAYWLLIKLYEDKKLRFGVIDSQRNMYYRKGEVPRVILIHNILANATGERLERIRDTLLRYPLSVRIVVLCGVRDPYVFCVQNIGLVPHFCVRFDQQNHEDYALMSLSD
jgi:hypothetical protein